MKKAQFLNHWTEIDENQNININSVPYKHRGSTFDCDVIMLTGSSEFIDSVLSRLKDLLDHENHNTRLQVVYKKSIDRKTQLPLDAFNCYIQVHERGNQAKMMNHAFGRVTY